MPAVVPRSFTFDLLRKTEDLCAPCDEEGFISTDSGVGKQMRFLQYEVEQIKDIWYRVVCVNDVGLSKRAAAKSYLGRTGHIERANVWTHLLATAIFATYCCARPFVEAVNPGSLSSTLAAASYASFVVTFLSSSTYHVYSANSYWSSRTRMLDYFGIYLGISTGTLSDLSTVTLNLKDTPWQSIADVWIGMGVIVVFFAVRRARLSVEQTRLPYLAGKCSLGFARSTNVDLEHSSLRATAGVAMAFAWVQMIPGAFETLELDCAWVFSSSRFVGTGVLIAGMVLDNLILYPDLWFENDNAPPTACVCYSNKEGCGGGWICTSHALWHVFALFSTLTTTVGTEYVIATSALLAAQ